MEATNPDVLAFHEAFRRRGIYPLDVRTLSENSLRWARPAEDPTLEPRQMEQVLSRFIQRIRLRTHVDRLRHLKDRQAIWAETRTIQEDLKNAVAREACPP